MNVKPFKFLAILALAMGLAAGTAFAGGHGGDDKGKELSEAGKAAYAGEDPNKPRYVKIAPLILPVIGDNGIEQIVSLVVIIEAANKDSAEQIIELSPRLNDAFITDLYGSIDRREMMGNGLVNVAHIKDRLTVLSDKILGKDKYKSILVQGINQRPV